MFTPGEWGVIAKSESGVRIGIVDFDVVSGTPPRLRKVQL